VEDIAARNAAPELQRDLALAYARLATLTQQLGQLERARASYEKGLVVLQKVVAGYPGEADWCRDLCSLHFGLARLYEAQGNTSAARGHLVQALQLAEQLVVREQGNASSLHELALAHLSLGDLDHKLQQHLSARKHLEGGIDTLAIAEELTTHAPDDLRRQRDLLLSCRRLVDLMHQSGQQVGHYADLAADLDRRLQQRAAKGALAGSS
jgi:tetratricopeptide (TPR) repeat protein